MSTSAALALSTEHLRIVGALYEDALAAALAEEEDGETPLSLAKKAVRINKRLFIEVQKQRRHPRMMHVHVQSHAKRMKLEQDWEKELHDLSQKFLTEADITAAYNKAKLAWIEPPPEPPDGVFASDTSLLKRLRKAMSKPKPSDITEAENWPGKRGQVAQAAVRAGATPGVDVYVIRGANGEPLAIASVEERDGVLYIEHLAAEPGAGNGTKMMQELAKKAAGKGMGLELSSIPSADTFYQGLGMKGTPAGQYSMSPSQVAAFAVTGGTMMPGSPRGPSGTAGADQLALNALTGVSAGESATYQDVQRSLMSREQELAWREGGVQQYIGLSIKTAEQAGQVSLDHLGLHKTFEFANPRVMAQDTFAVRGSKVIENMYGAHTDSLTKIITEATDPRHPKTIQEVKASIKEQWPKLQGYQVERIARTETAAVWTTTAANAYAANGISQFETIVASGPSIGINSEDPCDECVDAAADVYSIDDDLPPWHPNCRCEAIPVLEDEDGTPWLPPDEPWTGGAEHDMEPAADPEEQVPIEVQPSIDPTLAAEKPIPAEYQQKIDQYGLDRDPRDMPKGTLAKQIFGDHPDTRYIHQTGWSVDSSGQFIDGTWTPERASQQEQWYRAHFDGKVLPTAGETPQAFFTAGGSGAGKGGSEFMYQGKLQKLSDLEKRDDFVVVDPDRIKKMTPEFKALMEAGKKDTSEGLYAGAGVHEESSQLAAKIMKDALAKGYNVIYDSTASSMKFMAKVADAKDAGYETQVVMTSIPTNDAIIRSIDRADRIGGSSEGRFVSIPALRKAHANSSKVMGAWQKSKNVDSWRVYDNSGKEATVVAHGVGGGEVTITDAGTYAKIQAKQLQTVEVAPAKLGTSMRDPKNIEAYDRLSAPLSEDAISLAQGEAAPTVGRILDLRTGPFHDDQLVHIEQTKLSTTGSTYEAQGSLWGYKHGNTTVLIESPYKDKGLGFQRAKVYQEYANEMLNSWNGVGVEKLKTLFFSQGRSPMDAEFARRFSLPEFRATAQANALGEITIWEAPINTGRSDVFDHEMGHVIGKDTGPPIPSVWEDARTKDEATSKKYHAVSGVWNAGRNSVSDYGATNEREDWAESIRLYMHDKREGEMGAARDIAAERIHEIAREVDNAPRPAAGFDSLPNPIKVRFKDVFPERAKLIDQWAFGTGPTNQVLIDALNKQIEGFNVQLVQEMKLRGDAQAESNIAVIQHKLGQLQEQLIREGGAPVSDEGAALAAHPAPYFDAMPTGAKVTVPKIGTATDDVAGTWTKQTDGQWKNGKRVMTSNAYDVALAAVGTILLPGPALGRGQLANLTAWSIFTAQVLGYIKVGEQKEPTAQHEREALANRAGVTAPVAEPRRPSARRTRPSRRTG